MRYLIEGDVIKEGSVVYFKRGDEWRGETLYLPSKDCDITISAYGTGPKPIFNGSRDNYAKESYWEEIDPTNHIYRFVSPSGTAADYWQDTHWDVGAIVLTDRDGNVEDSPKCLLQNNSDDTKTNKTTGKPFSSYSDLDNLHFFHDTDKNGAVNINGDCELYLRCDEGNPGSVFMDIEFLEGRGLIQGVPHIKAPTIDNIEFRNCSTHAISIPFSRNLTVKNCVFNWVGGATQYDTVRYGNGIEIWGSAENFKIIGNHMWYAGYGFCEQRSDKYGDAHIKSWSAYNKCLGGFHISDNIFAVARNCLIETRYGASESARPVYSNNTYIQYKNRNETGKHYLGNVGSVSDAPLTVAFDDNVRSTISTWGDNDARIVWIDKTTLTLTRTSATVYVKGNVAIRATVRNGRGKTTYNSRNTRVARVDSKGKITALKSGRAKITVTNNKVSKVFTLKVINPRLNATGKALKVKKAFTLRIIIVKTNGITLKCKVRVK